MTNLEIIQDCLRQIDPRALQYDDWLKVGAAIKHEGGSVDLWDQWSRTDPRYRNKDCAGRWSGLDKGSASVTVATIVKLCKEQGGTPPKDEHYVPELEWYKEIPLEGEVFWPSEKPAAKAPIVRKEWLEIEPLPADSGAKGEEEFRKYLETLFAREECVGFVAKSLQTEPNKEGKRSWVPAGKGIFSITAGDLLKELTAGKKLNQVIGDWEPQCGAWIRFNPLDGNGVTDSNVTEYRYALVESDDIGIDEQWTIYRKLELPIAAVVHSGGKSLHAIVRIEASDYKEYQKRVDTLYEICKKNGLAIDRKNRNPSRLSRLPGVDRNGVRQRLVATNIGKESWAEWIDWIAAQDDDLPEVESLADIWTSIPPLADCLIEGILRKGHKMLVSGPSKAGKSFLLLELAIAIAEGSKWLGWQCQQGRVLYVNLELDRASCLHRIKDIYDARMITSPEIGNLDVWNLRGKSMPMTELAPRLIRRALRRRYSAVIIDPIYKVITGDENSADQMAQFCNQFDKVCSELGCAVIYCHHHSKGEQGQKRAQDRASGSGVFARDPDALIDMLELEIDDKRRAEVKYKFQVRTLQRFLDKVDPDWKAGMDMEDAEKLEVLIARAREKSPDADRINSEEIRKAEVMTGWRISGILREFPAFQDRHTFFRYPLHVTGEITETLLQDCSAIGEMPLRKPMSREERAAIGKETARQKKADTIAETRMAFDALNDGQPVTTKRLAEYLGITERGVRDRMKNAGYSNPEGMKGVWINAEN